VNAVIVRAVDLRTCLLTVVSGGVLLGLSWSPLARAADGCEALKGFRAAHTKITSAVTADSLDKVPGAGQGTLASPMCRVNGYITAGADSHVTFEVWLPPAEVWNHKYQAVGNGGLSGALNYRAMLPGFNRGYATMTTDLGHDNDPPTAVEDARWALGHPQKVVDYAYRAEHLSTQTAKLIIRAYYDQNPAHAYFTGCSAGGIAGMTELLRYPKDYDGYIIGDATPDHLGQEMGAMWNTLQASLAHPAQALGVAQLSLVHREVLRQCVAIDGGAPGDRFLTNPAACRLDLKPLQCREGQGAASCLTAEQVAIFDRVYQGPIEPRTHETILSGLTPGSELMWDRYFVGKKNPVDPDRPWAGFLTDMVYSDPQYLSQQKYLNFDFDRDYEALRRQKVAGESLDSSWNTRNRNLDTFERGGGRIIHYHGWDDPNIPPLEAVKFFEEIVADQARRSHLSHDQALVISQQFYRLFMVPGMGHCAGGDGPWSFGQNGQRALKADPEYDTLIALERWVEQGVAPAQFIGARVNADTRAVEMTRPICAYPQQPVWNGTGSANDVASFTCALAPGAPAATSNH
jgi:feruloyl esterase